MIRRSAGFPIARHEVSMVTESELPEYENEAGFDAQTGEGAPGGQEYADAAGQHDPNLAAIESLKAKLASGGELTDEEEDFLTAMADDPRYPVSLDENEDEDEADEAEGEPDA